MPYCPKCDGEFVDRVSRCPDCDVPLTDVAPEQAAQACELLSEIAPGTHFVPVAGDVADWTETAIPPPVEETTKRPVRGTAWLLVGFALGLAIGVAGPRLLERGPGPESQDSDGDGRPDTWWTYRGRAVASMARDLNGDGRRDSWTTYYGTGHTSWERRDSDFDGRPDQWTTYLGSVLVSSQRDRNEDGNPDVWTRYEQGIVVEERNDLNFDGAPDVFFTFRDSQLDTGRHDTDFDGTADVEIRYRDTLPAEAVWEPRPGAPQRKVSYRHGLRRGELRDLDGDGRYDQRILYDAFEFPSAPTAIP